MGRRRKLTTQDRSSILLLSFRAHLDGEDDWVVGRLVAYIGTDQISQAFYCHKREMKTRRKGKARMTLWY